MADKKPSYITLELEWMEAQISALKEQVEKLLSNPKDRYGPREMPNGRIVDALISSAEDQLKTATAVMEKIPKMLAALDELRSREEKKIEARGNTELSSTAEKWMKNRG